MGAALAAIFFAAGGTALAGESAQAGSKGAVPEGKIAVVKSETFPEKILELKQKFDQIEAQYRPRFEKIRVMAEDLKKLEDELRTKEASLNADKLRQLQRDYEDLRRRGSREEADLQEEYTRAVESATRQIQEKLAKFTEAYATQRNIVAVFNLSGVANTGLFAFWDPATDITDDFVAEYNKANPVAAGTTPPAKP
jgi:outer membrane protein